MFDIDTVANQHFPPLDLPGAFLRQIGESHCLLPFKQPPAAQQLSNDLQAKAAV
jgi:hypothetical protein